MLGACSLVSPLFSARDRNEFAVTCFVSPQVVLSTSLKGDRSLQSNSYPLG